MRALLSAVGTRGDVQPALALALELRKLGHAVRMCISPNFVDWARSLGLEAVAMGVEMRMPAQRSGTTPELTPEELRRLRESMPDLITDQFETIGNAADGCDVILGCNAHQYAAPSIAEHAGIGCVTAVYAPVALPSPDLAPPPTPGQAAAWTTRPSIEEQWNATAKAWNERALERINRNRDRLGMGPIDDVLDYVLTNHTWLAADAMLAPMTATPGREIFQTGSWVLADNTPLSEEAEAFLEGGEPPIHVGFGSMPAAGDMSRHLIGAARSMGRRIIVSRGWADLDLIDNAPDCLVLGDANYDRLFPRVAAVIHHGGAGTTATAARAGVPQVITPMFSDQFYWANRIVDLGLGAATPHETLTEESLTASLREVLHPTVEVRARTLAGQIRRDGAAVAARRLELEYGAAGTMCSGA
ncbi:MAG: glycosyl transferase [Acidobacteria bacterium]|nr:MAG: glycosyl transferase [Acidobacteriota bacterium]